MKNEATQSGPRPDQELTDTQRFWLKHYQACQATEISMARYARELELAVKSQGKNKHSKAGKASKGLIYGLEYTATSIYAGNQILPTMSLYILCKNHAFINRLSYSV